MPDFLAEVLTWNKNYYNLMAVQTAVNMSLRPTGFITDGPVNGEWSREDKKLAMALTVLEKETCSKCGQPLWICRSDNKNLLFKVKRDTCYASAELEKVTKAKSHKELKNGEYEYTVPYMRPDGPLPSRKEYLTAVNED